LIDIDAVAGFTITEAVSVVPSESTTVSVTVVAAVTGFGLIVKVLAASTGFGITAVLLETTLVYVPEPPVIVNVTLSLASTVPVSVMLAGTTLSGGPA
jgi:hypothetical protein